MRLSAELLHETALFIKEYYDSEFSPDFCFHNFSRAVNIVRNCVALGVEMDLKKEDVSTLHLAAWFLETGYCKNYYNYQSSSVALANSYLKEKGVDEDIRKKVAETIYSTRMPQQPTTRMGQVICDASMYHLGDKNLLENIETLRKERQAVANKDYSDKEWLAENIKIFNDHSYFTSAANRLFGKRKQRQKVAMQNLLSNLEIIQEEQKDGVLELTKQESRLEASVEDIKLERGVETFFRITERRHMELTSLAHDKASLLISINSIVISIVLSVLITKLEDNRFLLLPTLLLVITCVSTIVLAIISTRPKFIRNAKTSSPEVEGDEVNILFFGDFSKLSLHEYKKAMQDTYTSKNKLYDSLSRDIYYQGVILVWKYKYINIAYNAFMYGFIITILAFIVAFAIRTT